MRVFALGYCGTGSSAIVQLLHEYENCLDDFSNAFEHVLFYMPHGLFDLEDALLSNNALLHSDGAINDFRHAMKRLNDDDYYWFGGYKNRFGNHFMAIVEEFLSGIIEFSKEGCWFNDYRFVKKRIKAKALIAYLTRKYFFRQPVMKPRGVKLDRGGEDGVINYAFPTPSEFYTKGKRFVDSYFQMIGYDSAKLIVTDQMLRPHHLHRFLNYAHPDDRFIVVGRDPRDLFLLSKYKWSQSTAAGDVFPGDAATFAHFYNRYLSTEKVVCDPRVLRICFEDLVYNYDETVARIEEFIGRRALGNHTYIKQYFDPKVSIKNTQVFSIDKRWEDEVQPIVWQMPNRLYSFPHPIQTSLSEITDPDPDTSKRK